MTLLKPRFALRSLFIVVTIVGAFCAYHVSWIRRRHELLAEYSALGDDPILYLKGTIATQQIVPRQTPTSKRNLLWLFGEPYHDRITIIRESKLVTPDTSPHMEHFRQVDDYLHQIADQEMTIAEKYFPESEVVLEVRSLPPQALPTK